MLDFPWFLKQAGDSRTKNILRKYEKTAKEMDAKKQPVELKEKQKFPLKFRSFKIWLNGNNVLSSLDIFQEIFKERDHTKLQSFIGKKDKVIVDLGANEGYYTLKMKENSPNARIIAVEPNPEAFRILKKNIETNSLKDVICINKAVASKNRKISFEIVKGKTTIGAFKVYKKYRKKGGLRKIIVSSVTLEKLCKILNVGRIDLLKIDAEGSELDILKGGKNILPNVKKAVIEYHGAQKTKKGVMKIMREMNFKILLMDEKKYYGDIYFKNNSPA